MILVALIKRAYGFQNHIHVGFAIIVSSEHMVLRGTEYYSFADVQHFQPGLVGLL